jgi:hypothetical protein
MVKCSAEKWVSIVLCSIDGCILGVDRAVCRSDGWDCICMDVQTHHFREGRNQLIALTSVQDILN